MSDEMLRSLIGVAFFAGSAIVLFGWWWLGRPNYEEPESRARASSPGVRKAGPVDRQQILDATPDEPVAFGYKILWLTIRSSEPQRVIRVLGLENVQIANWESGLSAGFEGRVFVSPPVDGWVFAVSFSFPAPGEGEGLSRWESWIGPMVEQFAEVQYFASHRVVSLHAWARFVDGRETRAYCYVGESGHTYVNRGEPAAVEQPWSPEGDDFGDCWPDEEDVLRVAAEWGLNPMTLEDHHALSTGWVGDRPA